MLEQDLLLQYHANASSTTPDEVATSPNDSDVITDIVNHATLYTRTDALSALTDATVTPSDMSYKVSRARPVELPRDTISKKSRVDENESSHS